MATEIDAPVRKGRARAPQAVENAPASSTTPRPTRSKRALAPVTPAPTATRRLSARKQGDGVLVKEEPVDGAAPPPEGAAPPPKRSRSKKEYIQLDLQGGQIDRRCHSLPPPPQCRAPSRSQP